MILLPLKGKKRRNMSLGKCYSHVDIATRLSEKKVYYIVKRVNFLR